MRLAAPGRPPGARRTQASRSREFFAQAQGIFVPALGIFAARGEFVERMDLTAIKLLANYEIKCLQGDAMSSLALQNERL
jgi:hypothetical protein